MARVPDHVRHKGQNAETIDAIYALTDKGIHLYTIRMREFLWVEPQLQIYDLTDERFTTLKVTATQ